jgi:hypothetical protein
MNAIVPATRADMSLAEIERLGEAIAKSNLFGIKTREQAITLMAIAQAEGRHPALAARDYDVIQGRPSKKAEAMMRDFLEAGGMVEWHALTDDEADATFSHPQGGKARINWNMARAEKAALKGKDNWKKFPRQMLRSRVVSEGVRTVWPGATSGFYETNEAADIPPPPHKGPTLEARAEPAPKPELTVEPEVDTGGDGEYGPPLYQFATKKGGTAYGTGSEWIAQWRQLIDTCARNDALDRLQRAYAMNQGPMRSIEAFDPQAVAEVQSMVRAALDAGLREATIAELEEVPAP